MSNVSPVPANAPTPHTLRLTDAEAALLREALEKTAVPIPGAHIAASLYAKLAALKTGA